MLLSKKQQERLFWSYCLATQIKTISSSILAASLAWPRNSSTSLLRSLAKDGLLYRFAPDAYLVPAFLPATRWIPNEFEALAALMLHVRAEYQLCGPTVFSSYGWEEQLPNTVFAYNTKLSGVRAIGGSRLELIKVAPSRLENPKAASALLPMGSAFPTKAKAIVDAFDDCTRFGSLPKAYRWLEQELLGDPQLIGALVSVILAYANLSSRKRLGYWLERQNTSEIYLRKIEKSFVGSTALVPLIPGAAKSQKQFINQRWRILYDATQS